jgi:autotransporter-associated beta strand protein
MGGSGSTFTSSVNVTGGILAINENSPFSADNALAVATGSTFNLNGITTTIAGLNNISGSGGAVVNNSTTAKTLTLGGGGSYSFSGVISGKVTATADESKTALTKSGSGTQTLSGANTYTGLTNVSDGTLAYGANDVTADTAAITVNGASAILDIASYNDTVGAVTLTNGTITGTSGVLSASGYTVSAGTASAILGGASSNLNKTTSGTVTLTRNNTYGGTTTVSDGTLLVNGAHSGTGTVTVASGKTLGGSGSLAGDTTVNGILAPGNAAVGTLTFGGALAMNNNSSLRVEIGDWTGTPGTGYDRVLANTTNLAGAITIRPVAASLVNFTDADASFTILTSTSAISSTATFTVNTTEFPGTTGTWSVALSGDSKSLLLNYTAPAADTTPPTWTATWPKADTATSSGFTARARINEAGTAYFVVVPDAATAPSVAQIIAGTDASNAPALASGSIVLAANTENSSVVSTLSASTAYDVYFVAQDDESTPNVQLAATKVDVTTLSSATPYDTWALGPFTNAFTNTAPGVDFDNDGLGNLLEFVLGGDPTISQAAIAPTATAAGTDLVVSFKRSDASELSPATAVKVQLSADLVTWNPADDITIAPGNTGNPGPIGASNASYTITNSGGLDTVTVTIPKAAAAKKFARVVATQP